MNTSDGDRNLAGIRFYTLNNSQLGDLRLGYTCFQVLIQENGPISPVGTFLRVLMMLSTKMMNRSSMTMAGWFIFHGHMSAELGWVGILRVGSIRRDLRVLIGMMFLRGRARLDGEFGREKYL